VLKINVSWQYQLWRANIEGLTAMVTRSQHTQKAPGDININLLYTYCAKGEFGINKNFIIYTGGCRAKHLEELCSARVGIKSNIFAAAAHTPSKCFECMYVKCGVQRQVAQERDAGV
jgi:hypothetical protein